MFGKVLQEIEEIEYPVVKIREGLYEEGITDRCGAAAYGFAEAQERITGIIRRCMEDGGWILCSKRLPEARCVDPDMDPEDIVWPEYIVTIKGASESTTLRYNFRENTWFDENECLYEVAAWQPFPAPYCPRQMAIGDDYKQRGHGEVSESGMNWADAGKEGFMGNSVTDMEYQNLDTEIKRMMRRSAKDAVILGYLLRRMMEKRLWTECYDCFDDYLREELHMDYTMASRFIGINKKYSVDGDSMTLAAQWCDYSQAALIEMLSMPPELEAKVTPDMTVRQVREVKRQAKEEKAKAKKEESAKAKRCDTYPGYFCHIEEIVKKHFTKGGNVEGCVGCCAICLKKRECEYTCEAVLAMDVIKLTDIPEEQLPGALIQREMEEEEPSGDEILNAEYRELETVEEVATSQLERSAYGLEKTVYPEGSLLTTTGCGHKYYCFSCAQECIIRQEIRYCRTAPLGNPFGCETMEVLEEIKAVIGEKCQFVNNDMAFHTAGSGEADPCCKDCKEDCGYRCQRSCQNADPEGVEAEDRWQDGSGSEAEETPEQFDELAEIKRILAKEQKTLTDYQAVGGIPAKLMFKQKTIVAALAAMVCDLENAEDESEPLEEVGVQPQLPVFKNNTQRKEWLGAYKDWGFWYRDENIGVEYYKYDFDNGARLIAEVYREEATKYSRAYESCFLHLVGGPEPPKGPYGVEKWVRRKSYCKHPNSETELVEFLKEMQRSDRPAQKESTKERKRK